MVERGCRNETSPPALEVHLNLCPTSNGFFSLSSFLPSHCGDGKKLSCRYDHGKGGGFFFYLPGTKVQAGNSEMGSFFFSFFLFDDTLLEYSYMRLFYLTVAVANDWSIRKVSGQKMPKNRCFTRKFEDLVASISGHFTDQQAAMRISGKC